MGMTKEFAIEEIIQNLKDAGCGPNTVKRFLALWEQGQTKEQLELLAQHREQLLDKVHKEEKRIDCLDYLVYQIEKKTPVRIRN